MDIDSVVEEIKDREEERVEEAERLREELSRSNFPGRETSFIQEVGRGREEGMKVAGVDGGLVRKEFHGVDVYMRRAVAAVFQYSQDSLETSNYIPEKKPSLRTDYFSENMDRRTADRLASLLRLNEEIEVATETAGGSDLLLLDGSLVPQPGDRPSVDSDLFGRYEELVERYRELYSPDRYGARTVGVVEDARSSRMCDVLEENGFESEVLHDGRDSAFLDYLLEPGERTIAVPYTDSATPVLDDIGISDSLRVFYLRTVEKDRPVRVEFISRGKPEEEATRIAEDIRSFCGEESSYGIPPVLLEADQRAKLSKAEIERFTGRLRSKLSHLSGMDELRREKRPF